LEERNQCCLRFNFHVLDQTGQGRVIRFPGVTVYQHVDKHLYASRSRFIPAAIVSNFDVYAWPLAARRAAAARPVEGITVDLAARMRSMWRNTGT
jgi:hypothetical protein